MRNKVGKKKQRAIQYGSSLVTTGLPAYFIPPAAITFIGFEVAVVLGVMRVVLPREQVWAEALWNHVSKFPDFAIPPHTIGDLGRIHGTDHFPYQIY